jgi:hypothetical protein
VVAARKPRMHRSRHAADVAPTGSSFGLRTSTRVPGANLGSDTGSVAVTKRSMFGPPSNHRADPGRFLKKTGALSNKTSQRTFAVAMITGSYPAVAPAIFGVVCSRVCSCVCRGYAGGRFRFVDLRTFKLHLRVRGRDEGYLPPTLSRGCPPARATLPSAICL